MRARLAALTFALGTCVLGAVALRANAQAPKVDLRRAAWEQVLSQTAALPVLTQAVRVSARGASPGVPFRLAPENIFVLDSDGSNNLSFGDMLTMDGTIYSQNNAAVGVWEWQSSQSTRAGVGIINLNFSGEGVIVIGGGYPSTGRIRSGVPCRAIVGGTGAFAKITGNAGFGSDANNLYVGLLAK